MKRTVTEEYLQNREDEADEREELDLGDEPEDEADEDEPEHKPSRRRR